MIKNSIYERFNKKVFLELHNYTLFFFKWISNKTILDKWTFIVTFEGARDGADSK